VTTTRRDALLARVRREKLPPLQLTAPKLAEPDLVGLLGEAVRQYQRVRPYRTSALIPGDGALFDLPLPNGMLYNGAAAWVPGFSQLGAVESPTGQRDPVLLDPETVRLYPDDQPTVLRLLEQTPATGETTRVYYTAPHVFGAVDAAITVAEPDEEILANMVARLACLALATAAAENKSALIAADTVDYRSISQTYADRARDFGKLLPSEFQLAIDGKAAAETVVAASGWVDWDPRGSFDRPYVWHGPRIR
jgi:hypothetical protein